MRPEDFIQFSWKQRLFPKGTLRTVCGCPLEVFNPGELNFNAGPDFLNARIRLGNLEWAGNVEIHRLSSDWDRHGHQLDPSYNNVVLHVVEICDSITYNSMGQKIPSLILKIPEQIQAKFTESNWFDNKPLCHPFIKDLNKVRIQRWLTRLQTERLAEKTDRINRLLLHRNCNWESAFLTILAIGMGLPINSLPFELLISGIPFDVFHEQRDSLHGLEAVLFGQAGFLGSVKYPGSYQLGLSDSFKILRKSTMKSPLFCHLWKFLRMRPASFPTIRISQLAQLIHLRSPLMETFLMSGSLTEIEQLLRVPASEYWNTHYVFGKCAPEQMKFIGMDRIHSLIINSLVPFLFAYGKMLGKGASLDLGAALLSDLKAESNKIIKNWIKFGIRPGNAFESQALIQLHNVYCKQKRCFECQIGAGLFKSAYDEKK